LKTNTDVINPASCKENDANVIAVISGDEMELETVELKKCGKEYNIKGNELIHCKRRWTLVSSAEALFWKLENFISGCPQNDIIEMKNEVEQIYLNSMGTTDKSEFDRMEARFRHLNKIFLQENDISVQEYSNVNKRNDVNGDEPEIKVNVAYNETQVKNIFAKKLEKEIMVLNELLCSLIKEQDAVFSGRRNKEWNKPLLKMRKRLTSMKLNIKGVFNEKDYDKHHDTVKVMWNEKLTLQKKFDSGRAFLRL